MANATASTSTVDNRLRIRLAVTCPIRTAERRMGRDRNRSIAPVVMSLATGTPVAAAP
jgi:hypothetical protein